MNVPSAEHLKTAIIQSLCKQGYRVQRGIIQMPDNPTKDHFRALNELALQKKLEVLVPVFILPGNHDPLNAAPVYRSSTLIGRAQDRHS
jgi:DNA repair exonuclease SbcCD nuclease subunit